MHICFLDIDGTLVLTGGAGQEAFAETLRTDFGISEIDGRVPFAGRSDRAIAMELFRRHEIPASEENWRRFCRGYLVHLEQMLITHQGHILPGVPELLAALAARKDIAIGLLTGNIREGARRKLSHFGLWHWFAFGGFGDEHDQRCDIATAALAAAQCHLKDHPMRDKPDRIVVIGDTQHDIECGRSIGAFCVAVATGSTSLAVLLESRPDIAVQTLQNLGAVLGLFDTD